MSAAIAYVIEIHNETAGLVVRQRDETTKRQHYRFYASTARFRAIEGVLFQSPEKAQRAAEAVSKGRAHEHARPAAVTPRTLVADAQAFELREIA